MLKIFIPEIEQFIHLQLDAPLSEESINKCLARYNQTIVRYYDNLSQQNLLLEILKQAYACRILLKYLRLTNMQLRVHYNQLADKLARPNLDPKERAIFTQLQRTFNTILLARGKKHDYHRSRQEL